MVSTVALVLVGCVDGEPSGEARVRVTDQADGEFLWACGENGGGCEIHRIAGTSPPLPDCDFGIGIYFGYSARFVKVAPFCPHDERANGWIVMDQARMLICEGDSDCPSDEFRGDEWECRAGYCQSTDIEEYPPGMPNIYDLGNLCLSRAPRWSDYRRQWRKFTPVLDAACPGAREDYDLPCAEIPVGCDDPR